MIGTVGSKEKAELAKANGAHHIINYRDEDFVAKVKEITNGKLCDVVYDGIGKDTFPASLDCIRPMGMFVSYRRLVGPDRRLQHQHPADQGLAVRDPADAQYLCGQEQDLVDIAADMFKVVGSGAVKIPINQKYALKDAEKAHHDLEGRGTTGASILVP